MTRAPAPDSPGSGAMELLRRYIRQRSEFGVRSWPFEGMERGEAVALLRRLTDPGRVAENESIVESAADPVPSPPPVVAAPAHSANADPPSAFAPPKDYDALREAALVCTRCRLAGERSQVVFSDGNPEARVMVVGEAPGANEDRTGLPFVGAAGKLLDLLLAGVGLSRKDSVYICNVLKCRPPGNRNPRPDEIETCAPWLHRQIELVRPEVILAVGTFAGQLLSGRESPLGRLRGEVYSYRGTPLVVTYHPAALLRNSRWTPDTWDDLQLLRRVLDGS